MFQSASIISPCFFYVIDVTVISFNSINNTDFSRPEIIYSRFIHALHILVIGIRDLFIAIQVRHSGRVSNVTKRFTNFITIIGAAES